MSVNRLSTGLQVKVLKSERPVPTVMVPTPLLQIVWLAVIERDGAGFTVAVTFERGLAQPTVTAQS